MGGVLKVMLVSFASFLMLVELLGHSSRDDKLFAIGLIISFCYLVLNMNVDIIFSFLKLLKHDNEGK